MRLRAQFRIQIMSWRELRNSFIEKLSIMNEISSFLRVKIIRWLLHFWHQILSLNYFSEFIQNRNSRLCSHCELLLTTDEQMSSC